MLGRVARAQLEPTGGQFVDVLVDGGFHPSSIVAQAGRPLRLVFRRHDVDDCTARVVFSAPRLDRRLADGDTTTVELPPRGPGEVRFTCGMGRYRGRISFVSESPSLARWLRLRSSLAKLSRSVTRDGK
jgi:plastocyanin domain-containing protein